MSNDKDIERLKQSFEEHMTEVLECTRKVDHVTAAGFGSLMEIAEYMMQLGGVMAERVGQVETQEQALYLQGQIDLLKRMTRDFSEIVHRAAYHDK